MTENENENPTSETTVTAVPHITLEVLGEVMSGALQEAGRLAYRRYLTTLETQPDSPLDFIQATRGFLETAAPIAQAALSAAMSEAITRAFSEELAEQASRAEA